MPQEIELKLAIADLAPLREKLRHTNATLIGDIKQIDLFYDRPDKSLRDSDIGLRIRSETTDSETRTILCYKGPRQPDTFKSRQEIELRVDSLSRAMEFLQSLGFVPSITVRKTRTLWTWQDCQICLDHLDPLGNFVEIEGPSSQLIQELAGQLGLDASAHIASSYARMLSEKCV